MLAGVSIAAAGLSVVMADVLAAADWTPAVISASGTVGAALIATGALRAWRRRNGIKASEPAELWQEGASIRKFLKEQVADLQTQIDSLSKRYTELVQRYDTLAEANDGLKFALEQAQQLVVALRAEREELRAEVVQLQAANASLKRLNDHLRSLLASHGVQTD